MAGMRHARPNAVRAAFPSVPRKSRKANTPPRAQELFFETGIVLAASLALAGVADLCLLAAGIKS